MQPVGDPHLLGTRDPQIVTVVTPHAAMTHRLGTVDGDAHKRHEDHKPPKHAHAIIARRINVLPNCELSYYGKAGAIR